MTNEREAQVSWLRTVRRNYEPGDWWRVPLLALALLGAWAVRLALPDTIDGGK